MYKSLKNGLIAYVKVIFCKQMCYLLLTLTLLWGWWGRCKKNPYLLKEEGREGGEKSASSVPAGARARTQDLQRARRGVPSCMPWGLFRQASLSVPIDRVGRLRNTSCCVFWR